jgi:hypothetical protein
MNEHHVEKYEGRTRRQGGARTEESRKWDEGPSGEVEGDP